MFDGTIDGGTLAAIISAATGLLVAVVAIMRPWGEKAKKRRLDNKNFRIWRDGQPEVKGVFDAVIAAPEQMFNMKEHMKTTDSEISKIKSGLTKLTQQVVEGQKETNQKFDELREMLNTGNGGDTNSLGDMAQRRAKRDGDWIDENR